MNKTSVVPERRSRLLRWGEAPDQPAPRNVWAGVTSVDSLGRLARTLAPPAWAFCLAAFAGVILTAARVGAAEPRVLFDFKQPSQLERVATSDSRITRVPSGQGQVLRVETGHAQSWPGVTLKAEDGAWNLDPFTTLTVSARNAGSNSLTLFCRVDNAGADGTKNCLNGSATLAPGGSGVIRVDLRRFGEDRLGGKLLGMRGYPARAGGTGTIDASRVTQVLVFVSKPDRDHVFEVSAVHASGEFAPPTAKVTDADPYFPLIDTFGQYRHRDWTGKVRSLDDLRHRQSGEVAEITVKPGPQDWDEWGGMQSGPSLKATGYFRVEKHGGKWWLVDPAGHLFWSHGVDCVRMTEFTVVTGRETWFEDFPGNRPEFESLFQTQGHILKGDFAGQTPRGFAFGAANLMRKHGTDWRKLSASHVHKRLRSWGLNTIGNWSDEEVRRMRVTPYVDTVTTGAARRIEGSEGYWGKFPDPFDPSFRESLKRGMAGRKGRSAGDPWCIGFFSDNEIAWGDETSLALASLQSPANQAAKRAFLTRLQATHGTIAALNEAWGTSHASWEALLESRVAPDRSRAREDLLAFTTEVAEAYFRTARETIREAAPDQLFLGCRFAWVNARAAAVAARHCDVVSYNLYQRSVADFEFNGGADVPLMIGEFHFGALDRGLFHTGLVPTASQQDRAAAYQGYVLGALRHPQFVGTHWFQYQDQPTTGRAYDEENYQIGLVDIADTPYTETIGAVRDVGWRLYEERLRR